MPKLAFGCPIEDLEPRLDRKEFLEQMIIKPINKLRQQRYRSKLGKIDE